LKEIVSKTSLYIKGCLEKQHVVVVVVGGGDDDDDDDE
jgi:hypothetical protein